MDDMIRFGGAMRRFIPLLLAALLIALPAAADARPGLGSSFGSRGTHTWSAPPSTSGAPYGATPFQRSMTPNSGYGSPGYGNYGSGYGGYRRPFFGGLMGGLFGAGLLGLLLGGGFFGFHGGFGFLGLLFQLLILFWIARWLMRSFLGTPAFAGMGGYARSIGPQPVQGGYAAPGGGAPQLAISQSDYQQFSQLLLGIQAAWTARDLTRLGTLATPEMVSYFAEQLAELQSRGVRNEVRDVRLLHGDLSEAWSEGNREYASVSLKYALIDVTLDATGRIVDGSPTEHVTVTEFWTFLRAPGGRWLLSAIQQAR
jgi:predicted lipid-binding transport protein (Tim44 family)